MHRLRFIWEGDTLKSTKKSKVETLCEESIRNTVDEAVLFCPQSSFRVGKTIGQLRIVAKRKVEDLLGSRFWPILKWKCKSCFFRKYIFECLDVWYFKTLWPNVHIISLEWKRSFFLTQWLKNVGPNKFCTTDKIKFFFFI